MVSIIIPARNEPYLQKTIEDLLAKAEGQIEIIVNLDGYWPDPLPVDPKVIYIHRGSALGMRAGINACAEIAKGEFLMKMDAHVMVDQGYDVKLAKDCGDQMVVVPRRFPLIPEKWELEERKDDKYPIDYEYIDFSDLHGVEWRDRRNQRKDIMVDETITAQGSCWFTSKKHFEFMEGLDDESYGSFFLEFQEISLKTWLSGGKVIINKNVSYGHWHKNEGRGYSLGQGEREKAVEFMKKWVNNTAWHKQTLPFESLIERFMPIPTWPENWKEVLK